MAKKRVIIACGNGVATSTVVASKVKDYCAANGVSIEVTQCRMIELHDKADDYDLVVTTGKFSDPDIKTPCIMPSPCSPASTRSPRSRRSSLPSRTSTAIWREVRAFRRTSRLAI